MKRPGRAPDKLGCESRLYLRAPGSVVHREASYHPELPSRPKKLHDALAGHYLALPMESHTGTQTASLGFHGPAVQVSGISENVHLELAGLLQTL